MNPTPDLMARAFGEGCDARIAGLPLSANAFQGKDWRTAESWWLGWKHVDRHWGCLAKGRWPVRGLPAVGKAVPA